MKFAFSKNLKLPSKGLSGPGILLSLRRISGSIIAMLLIGVVAWVGYLWYRAVYSYQWTEAQKIEYRNEYAGQTSFRAERFTRTVEVLKERVRLHQTPPAVAKDVFTGTSL